MKEADAVEIERKIREVRPAFTVAVRTVYDKVDGLLKEGWKHDMVLAALETDYDLMSRCKGIPIECLMKEAVKAVKKELDAHLASVLPDFKRTFDVAYDVASAKWLRADAAAFRKMRPHVKNRNSPWEKIRRCLFPEYRRKAEMLDEFRKGDYMWRRTCAWRWNGLCISLVDAILDRNEGLQLRCQGVDKNALIGAVHKECPQRYDGAYYEDGYEICCNLPKESGPLTISEDVDIEEKVMDIYEEAQRAAREAREAEEKKGQLCDAICAAKETPYE